jgi:hypothetical protein
MARVVFAALHVQAPSHEDLRLAGLPLRTTTAAQTGNQLRRGVTESDKHVLHLDAL